MGTVWSYIREHKSSCRVYPAPLAVYLTKDNRTYLEPDTIVVCSRDYLLKLNKYQAAGVREYCFEDKVHLNVMDGLVVDFSEFEL